jgi:hypothetical protein
LKHVPGVLLNNYVYRQVEASASIVDDYWRDEAVGTTIRDAALAFVSVAMLSLRETRLRDHKAGSVRVYQRRHIAKVSAQTPQNPPSSGKAPLLRKVLPKLSA